jgi:hypothetical protein
LSLEAAGLDPKKARQYRTKLLDISGQYKFLTIHPINTLPHNSGFLRQRYGQVERITLEDTDIIFPGFDGAVPTTPDGVLEVLENLPSGFTKDFSFGLGIAKSHRFIVDAVETLSDCTEIVITGNQPTGQAENDELFYISKKDFEQARRVLNSIDSLAQTAARAVKSAAVYNVLAERLGVPKLEPKIGRHPYRKAIHRHCAGQGRALRG